MSVEGAGPVETWPVAQHQALRDTSPIVVMGNAGKFGFAVFAEDEWAVRAFDDRVSRDTALARIFTSREKWGYPLSWEDVFAFEPDRPLRFVVTVEVDEEDQP